MFVACSSLPQAFASTQNNSADYRISFARNKLFSAVQEVCMPPLSLTDPVSFSHCAKTLADITPSTKLLVGH